MIAQDLSETVRQVLRGERECIASHAGRSQYSAGGMSACGLAALNCVRIVLQREQEGSTDRAALIQGLMQRETCEEILGICFQWPSSAHLDVEEIYSAPIFKNTLALVWSGYDQPGFEQFQALLGRLEQSTPRSAALVITRPPEIVSILKIVTDSRMQPLYVSFDSHPRSKHPEGAAFIFHTSLDAAAFYLSELLQYDAHLLNDPALHWQAQLLAHYSAHMFVAGDSRLGTQQQQQVALIDASLEVLRLKVEVAELREKNRGLESDARNLMEENGRLEAKVEDLEDSNLQLHRRVNSAMSYSKAVTNGSSGLDRSSSSFAGTSSPWTSYSDHPSTSPTTAHASTKGKLVCRFTDELDADDELFATRVQLEWQQESGGGDDDAALALRTQKQYEEEDRQLHVQMEQLAETTPKTFECGICMETLPEDVIAQIESCSHNFCRQCLLQYLQSKLADHRFPILCPTCSAERISGDPGTISGLMATQIGLSEEEYAAFTELELASFSVLLHCRQCQQAVFVDKVEYDEQEVVACPLPGCTHAWCKACSRSIDFAGPKHSCDGTSELNHLMNQQGWKNCPACRTPISKSDGCNHMTCIAPGCNVHFCYVCGESIVQSVRRQDIRGALERHYARCRLIDEPI
ncbi:hypothetical protein BC835DRAFT_1357920 [Cytidiella melzeri]|nr:hypothetical protein BC835DRAFT_1357920 [Cytidiella melzeri]